MIVITYSGMFYFVVFTLSPKNELSTIPYLVIGCYAKNNNLICEVAVEKNIEGK